MMGQDNRKTKKASWSDLEEKDQKRLVELLDELIQIFSSDNPSGKIEIIKDIKCELCDIKNKYE